MVLSKVCIIFRLLLNTEFNTLAVIMLWNATEKILRLWEHLCTITHLPPTQLWIGFHNYADLFHFIFPARCAPWFCFAVLNLVHFLFRTCCCWTRRSAFWQSSVWTTSCSRRCECWSDLRLRLRPHPDPPRGNRTTGTTPFLAGQLAPLCDTHYHVFLMYKSTLSRWDNLLKVSQTHSILNYDSFKDNNCMSGGSGKSYKAYK